MNEPETQAPYPNLADVHADLVRIIELTPPEKRPVQMPQHTHDAARWLISILEPHKHNESPRQHKGGWRWLYRERVVYLAAKFLKLNPEFQRLIFSASEDKIWWRGDEMDMFSIVIGETLAYREDPAKYRRQTLKRIKSVGQMMNLAGKTTADETT